MSALCEIARIGEQSCRPRRARAVSASGAIKRRLRLMKLRDGRVHLVDQSGAIFMPCANETIARQMAATFST